MYECGGNNEVAVQQKYNLFGFHRADRGGEEAKERHREESRASMKVLKEERAAAGLCTKCGKRAAEEGRRWCKECQAKQREWNRNHKEQNAKVRDALRKKRAAAGFCTKCGKRPPKEGYQWCEECLKKDKEWYKQSKRHKKRRPRNARPMPKSTV